MKVNDCVISLLQNQREIFAYFGLESGLHFRKLVPLGQLESDNMDFQNHEGSCFEAGI